MTAKQKEQRKRWLFKGRLATCGALLSNLANEGYLDSNTNNLLRQVSAVLKGYSDTFSCKVPR